MVNNKLFMSLLSSTVQSILRYGFGTNYNWNKFTAFTDSMVMLSYIRRLRANSTYC
jgi:hypothetical protein